jgi:hypothetical protein
MTTTQVKSNFRSSITIPEKSWARFRDVFSEYVEKMTEALASDKPAAVTEASASSSK